MIDAVALLAQAATSADDGEQAAEAGAWFARAVGSLPPWLLSPAFWGLLAGVVGLWMMFGQANRWVRTTGGLCGVLGVVLIAFACPYMGAPLQHTVFWMLAGVAIIAAGAMIVMRSPLYSAIWFAVVLLGVSGMFIVQGAQFLGVATLVVYAGAILVTFLFVLMLCQPEGHDYYDRISWGPLAGVSSLVAACLLVGGVVYLSGQISQPDDWTTVRKALATLQTEEGERRVSDEQIDQIRGVRRRVNTLGEEVLVIEAPAGAMDGVDQVLMAQPGFDLVELETDTDVLAEKHVATLGGELFSARLISLEAAGTLLLAALVGAIAIVIQGRRKHDEDSAEPVEAGGADNE